MSVLILVLAMKAGGNPTSVSIPLKVDETKCEEVYIPMAKQKYMLTSLKVVSAQCFPN